MQQKVSIKKTLKQIGFFAPFTVYFGLFMLGSFLCFIWLKNQPKLPNTPFHDIFILLLRITLYLSCTFLILGLLSVLISWLYFIYKRKKNKIVFHISTKDFDTPYQPIELSLQPILRPILGYIKLRFVYDNGSFSDKIQLVEDEHANWFNKQLNGFYDWKIQEIKEFRIRGVIVYFEDFLQFYSLAIHLNTSERFYTPPQIANQGIFSAKYRNTEKRDIRIDQMRKVKGDLFNYKKFDSSDDVRRIVWKIYAKNKELVIRNSEILDPYASHLFLYVSYYSKYFDKHGEVTNSPLLNYYKNVTWGIYKHLSERYKNVRWISDQPQKAVSFESHPGKSSEIKHLIALSDWQKEKDVLNFVQPKNASIVVVSSLTDVAQIKLLIQKYGEEIKFLFVPLSKCFSRQGVGSWLQWIFYQQEKDQSAKNQTLWALSLLRIEIIKNEKKLRKIMANI